MKTITKDILANIICLILITIYFVCFNTQAIHLESATLLRVIDISSMSFLGISIILFEIGYRKEKTKVFINGIEILILAIFTLFIKHMPKVLNTEIIDYTKKGIYLYGAYYIIKSAAIYTKLKQDELQQLSDIKEIVKEEPRKKATKRKNIKVEEGK